MKNIKSLGFLVFAITLIVACSQPEKEKTFDELSVEDFTAFDAEKKKTKLLEFKNEFKTLELKLKQFEKAILKEDPSYTGKKEKKAKLITTTPVRVKDHRTFFEVTGATESIDDITLSAEIGGRIIQLGLKENQYVNSGDLILQIDNEAEKKQLNQLYTQLDLAQTILQKRENLWAQNIGSEIELIQARTNVKSLQNNIDAMNAGFDKFTQYSPISGFVEMQMVHQGEFVAPGSPIAKVVNFSRLKIKAEVNEKYLSKIKRGDLAKISIPTSNFSRVVPINEIGTRINPANNAFRVEFEFDNYDLSIKPDAMVYVELQDEFIPRAVIIPTNLIQEDIEGNFVYVAKTIDGSLRAVRKNIELDKILEEEAIVKKGLRGNELLIEKGFNDVVEDQLVTKNAKKKIKNFVNN